jgi:RHS repeat-associated protein
MKIHYVPSLDGSRVVPFVAKAWVALMGGTTLTATTQDLFLNGEHLGFFLAASTGFDRSALDWVGSVRTRVDPSANIISADRNFPFGEMMTEYLPGMATWGDQYDTIHFTGKERDTESGLDNFGARYYNSNMGRFLSPDPSGLAYAHLFNPQSFNLYGYVQNNPLTNTDPTGLDCVHINNDTGAYEGFESGDCDNSTDALANSGHYVDGTINQVSFNGQNQVIGYSGSTGDGQFDSFGGSLNAGGTAFSLNPYSLTGTAPGQSVSVTANPSGGPDTSTASIFSLIASGKIQPSSGTAEMRAVPKLTTGQIYSLCAVAVSLGAGGTVPGGSPRGTASLSPSEDTPPINMPFPGKNGLQVTAMNEGAAKVEGPVAGLALVGSLGECVNAVSKAN